MALRAMAQWILPALEVLGVDDLAGIQILGIEAFEGLHHPPLNPDVAALLLAPSPPDWMPVKKVLLNQYAGEHPLRRVKLSETPSVDTLKLADLEQAPPFEGPQALYIPSLPIPGSFERFQEIIAHLRAPEGCPWDRKQTHSSLRPYLLEEAYEVLDALDMGDTDALCEELGDLMLQVVLHSQIAVETGEFTMPDVLAAIIAKMIRRHPHVWGTVEVSDAEEVKANWDRLKQKEKKAERESLLDGVSKALPALSQAFSYQDRAARVKFDWETIEPVIAKVHEELAELLAADDDGAKAHEVGDLLFAVVNLARWMDVEPEMALRGTNARFYRRFRYIEQRAAERGRALEELSLAEMDALWDDAKAKGL